MAGWFCSPKSKEGDTSLLSEATPKQNNTTLDGVKKSLRNGSQDSELNVEC